MKEIVSIIIPVYNIKNELPFCVQSIVKQTFPHLEIIIVDDGSTDGCGELIDQYALEDKRVRFVHKSNGGLSEARNEGIKMATGRYLMFVDGDDALELNCVERMMEIAREKNADIVACRWSSFYEEESNINKAESKDISCRKVKCLSGLEAAKKILYQKRFDVSAWAKLYVSATFKEVWFPKSIYFEDIPTTYKAFLNARTVAFTDDKLYKYRIRNNSIEHESFSIKKMDCIKSGNLLMEYVAQNAPDLLRAAQSRYIAIHFHVLSQIYDDIPEQKQIQENIRKKRFEVITDNHASFRVRCACLISLFSFEAVVKLLRRN